MTIQEATDLIRFSPDPAKAVWLELGAGGGTFTRALARLLRQGSTIYAVDRQPLRLEPVVDGVRIHGMQADFESEALPVPPADGLLMANALHYVRHPEAFLERLFPLLQTRHSLLIVEYELTQGNPWVPYPLDFARLTRLAEQVGYRTIRKLGERPSLYGPHPLYAALIESSTT
ncbi:MAG: class I SAM-dependent methyltransferase [Siphonobacter aquaeclarae]|jgi:ubiquinone/menaquinone biosynthesis C-methylase UbiE|nr:class I SAM-dependent methyltransferase [Siphonobacter aquaeclarae]